MKNKMKNIIKYSSDRLNKEGPKKSRKHQNRQNQTHRASTLPPYMNPQLVTEAINFFKSQ